MNDNSFHANNYAPLFVGRNYTYISETQSTNLRIKTLMGIERPPEGTVISTGHQTEGRGQAGASWESGKDQNIMLSVLLYPKFLKAGNQFLLSKAMALAVRDFILEFLPGEPVKIKWPNDILVSGQKICGILIENGLKGEQMDYSIIGMGINVNEIFDDKNRTSFKGISALDYNPRDLEKVLFSCIEARYLQLRTNEAAISSDYLNVLYGFGQKRRFTDKLKNEDFEGVIKGINPDGRLIIETSEGETRMFNLKEVKIND